jgi:hypothetical protein
MTVRGRTGRDDGDNHAFEVTIPFRCRAAFSADRNSHKLGGYGSDSAAPIARPTRPDLLRKRTRTRAEQLRCGDHFPGWSAWALRVRPLFPVGITGAAGGHLSRMRWPRISMVSPSMTEARPTSESADGVAGASAPIGFLREEVCEGIAGVGREWGRRRIHIVATKANAEQRTTVITGRLRMRIRFTARRCLGIVYRKLRRGRRICWQVP